MSHLFDFTEEHRDTLRSLHHRLAPLKPAATDRIRGLLLDMAYRNKYTLHPRQIEECAGRESDRLFEFFDDPDLQSAESCGTESQTLGLGIETSLGLRMIFRELFAEKLAEDPPTSLLLQRAVDLYMNAFNRGFVTSLTEETLKNQEQIRQALSAALENQRRELLIKNHAIDTSINAIVLTELDGSITYVNPVFLKMWDRKREGGFLGRHIQVILGEKARTLLRALRDQEGWHGELSSTHGDGTPFHVEISASTIRDTGENPVGVMATFVDVTRRLGLEAQFRQAQKMEALGQLAGGIVHDFNNLLTAVSGFTQLALMDVPKEGKQYQDFMQIKIATDRGKGLTSQLRFFTKEATGERAPLELNKIIEETSLLLKRTFPKEVTIRQKLEPSLWTVSADASQMSQLLMNLCVNARDAMMSQNGEKDSREMVLILESRNVELDARRAARYIDAEAGRYIRITVSDSGMGMGPEVIDRLFEPFFTTKEANGGTGLGLAVVYGIVQNHGGFLDVSSRPDRGSTFEIYLPVVEGEKLTVAADRPPRELARGEGTVLVVEDEPQVRQMAVRTLQRCGYDVLTAENGLQALSLFESNRKIIDLVILDMIMPKMGGPETFHRLKEIDPGVKVICVTGYTADASYQDLVKEGVLGILEKPLDLYEFAEVTRKAIQRDR